MSKIVMQLSRGGESFLLAYWEEMHDGGDVLLVINAAGEVFRRTCPAHQGPVLTPTNLAAELRAIMERWEEQGYVGQR